jgi:signal transduction histidine kinase/ActR/RegA family two-component response regulator
MGFKLPAFGTKLYRPMSLRANLIQLVLAAIVPLVVFSVAMVVRFDRNGRAAFQRGAIERTLALLTAVDTELKSSITTLNALASSDHLDAGDLRSFHEVALRVLTSQPQWHTIDLASPSGRKLLDVVQPFGAKLSTIQERRSFEQVLDSMMPVVGGLLQDSAAGRLVFAVRVPVIRQGIIKYVLTATVLPYEFSALLAAQRLPVDWIGAVLDGNDRFVARTLEPEHSQGRLAAAALRAALDRSREGWFQGNTVESTAVYTAYNHSPFSSWTVALAIPVSVVEAQFRRSLLVVVSFGLLLLALGTGFAWFLSKRTAKSIKALSLMAEDFGSGKDLRPTDFIPSPVAELEVVEKAFIDAARLVQERSEALKEADRHKDEFLAILGHELRNPLGVINNSIELLRWEGSPDSALSELRAMMERQVEHMSRLLDDLLDISRINRGQIRLKKEPCNFTQTVRDTAEDFRPRLEGSGIELIVDVPDRPLWVTGDRTRLVQIIGNLLSNAQKYTEIGGRIKMRLSKSLDSADLMIRDTGTGMEPEVLARAFQPFSQSNPGLDRRGGGLGLGLALVKGLIDLHGGKITAHSDGPGQGSEFVITLPLDEPPAPAEQPHEASASNPRFCRILIIEDNRLGARTLRMLLTRLGHKVEVAYSGPEGMEIARRFQPQIVLCDIGLPGMDGYAVARAMRAESGFDGVCLLAITGYGQVQDQRRSLEAGFDMHLTKPVDLKKLQEVLASQCFGTLPNL